MIISSKLSTKNFRDSFFSASMRELGVSVRSTTIQILDEQSIGVFWQDNFGVSGKKRRIPDEFWMFSVQQTNICDWTTAFASRRFDEVTEKLRSKIARCPETSMCFFGGIEVILCSWNDFIEYWPVFLDLNDEGLLSELEQRKGLLISPVGYFVEVHQE